MRKQVRHLLGACIGGAVVAAVPGVASADTTLKMVFATALSTLHMPILAAEDQGYLKEEGITLEKVFVQGDANALRAVVSGDVDFGGTGTMTVINAVSNGAKVRGFFSYQPIADYNIIAREKGIGLSGLSGKTFASAGPLDMTTELPKMVLRKNGVDAGTVTFIQIGGHSARLQSVVAGKVDASMVNTFTAIVGERNHGINVITSVAKEVPNVGYLVVITNTDTLAKKKKELEAVTVALMKGARFVMKEPEKSAEIMKKVVPDMDLEVLKALVPKLNADRVWGFNGGVEKPIIDVTAQIAKDIGLANRVVSYEEVIDPSIVEAAIKKIGTF